MLQIWLGHGVYEGRKPALLDNLVDALFSAPYFVMLEVLFYLGFFPELKKAVDAEVKVKRQTFNVSNKIKK